MHPSFSGVFVHVWPAVAGKNAPQRQDNLYLSQNIILNQRLALTAPPNGKISKGWTTKENPQESPNNHNATPSHGI